MNRFALIFALLLSGCAPAPVSEPRAPRADPIAYSFDSLGIAVIGQSGRVDFGRTDHSALRAMRRLEGREESSREICAGGLEVVRWDGGKALYFARGAFRGWSAQQSDGSIARAGQTC